MGLGLCGISREAILPYAALKTKVQSLRQPDRHPPIRVRVRVRVRVRDPSMHEPIRVRVRVRVRARPPDPFMHEPPPTLKKVNGSKPCTRQNSLRHVEDIRVRVRVRVRGSVVKIASVTWK